RGLARQVPLLPPYLSPPGRVADWGSEFVPGDADRWLATPAAAVRSRVRQVDRAQPRAEALARRRDALAGLRHGGRQGRLPLVSVGLPLPGRHRVRALLGACPRRAGGPPGS